MGLIVAKEPWYCQDWKRQSMEPWSPISCWMEGFYQGLALLFHNGLLAGHFVTQS